MFEKAHRQGREKFVVPALAGPTPEQSIRLRTSIAAPAEAGTTNLNQISRRGFLKSTAVGAGALALGAGSIPVWGAASAHPPGLTVAELPKGAAPSPVDVPHFPDRLHAFVWRNWPLVPVARMAQVVGATAADLERMGGAMGLGKPPRISHDQLVRSYITIIRRNWHLLPYAQLLQLLGWTADKLAYTLREDDFLFAKLGNLKPECETLRYLAPDEAAREKENEIQRMVREEFPQGVAAGGEPLFDFVSQLSRKPAKDISRAPAAHLKFCYSYFALYGDPLLETEADPYPEGYLARLANAGVTGVWLQAVLYKLAPFPWDPERSLRYQDRLKNLRKLVARAAKHGIRVFLYLNEPRAMPLRFFDSHPQLKGVTEGDHATLCTSAPEVQRFLVESVASIGRAVPGLGGFFSITASENLTNCWSHGGGAKCPRCGKRPAPQVIAEVNSLFAKGIQESGSQAQLIAWDWGWNDNWAQEAIEHLPAATAFMSVSEWRLPLHRGGVQTEVGEYSISAVGPGPRARRHWELARQRGLKTIAKVQAGNTWELSAVPHIPAVENVARHAENLHRAGIEDVMLGWTLGGCPSSNLEVVSETLACGSAEEGMRRVAVRRFGPALAPAVISAWRGFSAAFSEFPFQIGVLYSGPQQMGPANLLWGAPTGYHATMVGFPYDDLESWRAVFPPDIFASQFEKMAEGFERTLTPLRGAASGTGPEYLALEEECRVAEAAAIHFRSVANQARFVAARRAVTTTKSREEMRVQAAILERVLKEEIELARRLHKLQSCDSRIGFEASNQYYYVPSDLAEKVMNCRHQLSEWLPAIIRQTGG